VMAEAYVIDAVRTPVGRRGGALSAVHSDGPRRACDQGCRAAQRHRPGARRRRDPRLHGHVGPAGGQHRAYGVAGRRFPAPRSGRDRRQAAGQASKRCTSPRRPCCPGRWIWCWPAGCRT
jgi:hypothetical protein